MSFSGYLRYTTGQTLYAKPLPLNNAPWSTDVFSGTENGTLGSYSFASLTEGTDYEAFKQAGGSPASTDLAIGSVSYGLTPPSGFLAATFPSTVASPTNITAATGVSLSAAGIQAIWNALTSALTTAGSIGKLLVDSGDGDATEATLLLVKAKTDQFTFTVANQVDANALTSNGIVPQTQSPTVAGNFTIWSGVDFDQDFDISIPSGWTKLLFTIKSTRHIVADDARSILQIQVSNPSDISDGILYLNQDTPTTQGDGVLTVSIGLDSVNVRIENNSTVELPVGKYSYDLAVYVDDTKPFLTAPGQVTISSVVTRQTT